MAIAENREGFEVSYVRHGSGTPDQDWIKKFADEGGTAIVSGDYAILQDHWPNLIAYTDLGLISFFPPKAFQKMRAFSRAAFIIVWWPAIIEKIKISKPGDRWRLPLAWTQIDHNKMEAIKDPRIDDQQDKEPTDTSKAVQQGLFEAGKTAEEQ